MSQDLSTEVKMSSTVKKKGFFQVTYDRYGVNR